ncbi:MAG: response regulator [Thiohalomonadales bacterium]
MEDKRQNSKFRILIVDDTLANVEVLSKTLRIMGYNIAMANSGKKALSIVERIKPDLILLDVMMPEMNGIETCQRLKANEATRRIPIIFITAKTDIADIKQGFQVGAVDYIAKPFNDEEVRARVQTHLTLKKSHDDLKLLNAQKDEFLGMAAHDLRLPLSTIIGYTELLQEDLCIETNDKHYEVLSLILNASKSMKLLINDLLDVSAIDKGSLSLDIKQGDLSLLIHESRKRAIITATKKNIDISVDCNESVYCRYDSFRITQVLENLISNAIKFSPSDSRICLSLHQSNEYADITVRDEGPGLTNNDLGNMFQDYNTLSAAPTAGEASTGLGLAICKRVVDAHGGNILVTNNELGGATFTLRLPMAA